MVTDVIRRAAIVWPLVFAPLGCSAPRSLPHSPPARAASAPRSSCAIGATSATPPESISIAVSSSIDQTRVPVPANGAERFVFAQVYETLIDVDCEGEVYAALASSWTRDATGTRATFVIRDGARFSDGKPVAASDVITAWRATGGQSTDASRLARRLADASTVIDDRTLTVSLPDTAWRLLADPALAVYEPQSGPAWAAGSGRYRVDANPGGASASLTLVPVAPRSSPVLAIRIRPGGDPRDAIDAGADLLVTRDPAALDYASTRPNLSAVALPWNRFYVLAVPNATAGPAVSAPPAVVNDSGFAASLARDAVQADARAARPPYWWSDISTCGSWAVGMSAFARQDVRRSTRVVYDRDDRVARGLAERVVAVGRGITATGLAPGDLARALQAGDELAYVLDLPRASLAPCQDLTSLASAAPWLESDGGPTPERLVPLVETRDHAVVSRTRVSATVDWDGTVRVTTPARQP